MFNIRSQLSIEFIVILSFVFVIVLILIQSLEPNLFDKQKLSSLDYWSKSPISVKMLVYSNHTTLRLTNNMRQEVNITGFFIDGVDLNINPFLLSSGNSSMIYSNSIFLNTNYPILINFNIGGVSSNFTGNEVNIFTQRVE